jgi:hypothetical protein
MLMLVLVLVLVLGLVLVLVLCLCQSPPLLSPWFQFWEYSLLCHASPLLCHVPTKGPVTAPLPPHPLLLPPPMLPMSPRPVLCSLRQS